MTLRQIIRSGYVTRWHAYPEVPPETNAHHQWAVEQVIRWLWPGASALLLRAASQHDCGELRIGDVTATAKDDCPELRELMNRLEADNRDRMGIHSLTLGDKDTARLKFADRAAAYLHVRQTVPHVLASDDWPEAAKWLHGQAWALGIGAEWEREAVN